ncbi:MAG: aminotransferase class V-fold PLP-dependent enzyme [Bacteroidota bacterium]
MTLPALDFATLRAETVGVDTPVETPFGERLLVYADFTASGRSLRFVDAYLSDLARLYANSHTEDSTTGRATTRLLHEAEDLIKQAVNAGPDGRLIACGTGSTGAIDKFQQLLGVALPPATRHALFGLWRDHARGDAEAFGHLLRERQPVVFVGPYEHHSNEVTWREGLATVIEVDLDDEGRLDLAHLETLLQDPRWHGRQRIGSFSAASNVTGIKTPVHEVARLLHRHEALACFDFAASAPYVEIDMNPEGDPEAALDAVFISPHKFLGGPGSCGVLVFNERVYPKDLAPSVGGGGTVVYVNTEGHEFITDVESREKAGTPGILQTLRAALAMQIKETVGVEAIEHREQELLHRAFERWGEAVEILGPADPEARVGIVSFNLRSADEQYLHPRFVTTLLDDLFGIQSRAGCSCAGPYAHRLLGIRLDRARQLLALSRDGVHGVKPGWCRVGFHYTMDDAEADYLIDAVRFVAEHGARFLPLYRFHLNSGTWAHRDGRAEPAPLSVAAALGRSAPPAPPTPAERAARYAHYLDEARALAEELAYAPEPAVLGGDLGTLQYFSLAEGILADDDAVDAFCGGF